MTKRSIIIIDSKRHSGSSWKKTLSRHHEVVIFRDSGIIGRLCREGIVQLLIMNMYHSTQEFELNILRRLNQNFPKIPVLTVISYRCLLSADHLKKYGSGHMIKKPFSCLTMEEKIKEIFYQPVACAAV
ncbi:MAG: hypothetical protein AB7S78_01135 [Candidatus Omnitrophota bacterium]